MNYDDEIRKLKRRMSGLEDFLLSAQMDIEDLKNHKTGTSDRIAIGGIIIATIIGVIQILIACFK